MKAHVLAALASLLLLPTADALAHGPLDEEIAALSIAIARNPGDADLLLQRAELRRLDRRWEDAEQDLGLARSLVPEHPGIPLCRAALWIDTGRPEPALAMLDDVLERDAGSVEALSLRVRVQDALGRHAAAAADLDRLIAASRRPSPDLYLERARRAALEGPAGGERALDGIERGIERLGSITSLEDSALELELSLGRIDAALARLERRLAGGPRLPGLHIRRAEILAGAGRPLESWAAYTEALETIRSLPSSRRGTRAMASLEARVRAALALASPEAQP